MSSKKKRLFIIDAMAMAFRNYHAFSRNPLTTGDGTPVSAVYGSLTFLWNLIQKEQPDYLIIANDSKEKTFRHELYSEYKANRKPMPEDLAIQLPILQKLYDSLGCKVITEPGLEADDLIGSLVSQFDSDDLECFIVSGDKDFMQLLNERIKLYSPKKGGVVQILGTKEVKDKFGCAPHQVIDILAIMGDSADNVPGIPGIGEKGAIQLVEKYHSLEKILENKEKVTAARQRKGLMEHADKGLLSKKLVTIKIDHPLPWSLTELAIDCQQALANPKLLELTTELEFKVLTNKVTQNINKLSDKQDITLSLESSSPQEQEQEQTKSTTGQEVWQCVTTQEKLDALKKELELANTFSFDTETTGLKIASDSPIGISIATRPGSAWYIPLIESEMHDLSVNNTLEQIRPYFESSMKTKVGHNLKFDIQMLKHVNINVALPLRDTMIEAHLLESNSRTVSLDACCIKYLNYKKIPTSELIGKKGSMLDVPIEKLSHYACEDADLTLQLHLKTYPMLKDCKAHEVYKSIEIPLIPILAQMEANGINIDTEILKKLSQDLDLKLSEITKDIHEAAGEEFNINSPAQLQKIIFEKLKLHEELGIKRIKKTKSGYSTDVTVMEQMSQHILPRLILEYRAAAKLKNTYTDSLPEMVDRQTGRIHAHFHQTGTATGRLSSSEPNLQNIPIKTPSGQIIRNAFRAARDGHVIISADYSQVELRVLAHLSEDEGLMNAFIENQDVHTETASKIFKVAHEEVTAAQRSQAKSINFGIIYGMGAQRLSRETGISIKEAKIFINRYFELYPRIQQWIETSIDYAKKNEETTTILGRTRPLPEIGSKNGMIKANAQNIAINSPVQGSAADLIKAAMVKTQKKLDESKLHAKMLLQVHDELVFECPEENVDEVMSIIKSSMESAIEIKVPLKVEMGVGNTWLEAH